MAGSASWIRAVLFDLDNTLYDHETSSRKALAAAAREFARTAALDVDQLCGTFTRHNDECWVLVTRGEMTRDELRVARFRRTLTEFGIEDLEPKRLSETYLARYRRGLAEVPEARRTVLRLLRDLPVGIVTNGFPDLVEEKLAAIGLAGLLHPVVVADRVEVMKPRPDAFLAALHALGLPAHDVLYVGDSLAVDVAGGAASGLRTCWFNRSGLEAPPGGPRPDAIVRRLSELLTLLLGADHAERDSPVPAGTARGVEGVAGGGMSEVEDAPA
jgi:putative hydrolase of the HAD superfamily